MTNKIYLHVKLKDELIGRLRDELPTDCILMGIGDSGIYETFAECGIAFGNVPLDWVKNSTSLRWLQLQSTGTDPYVDYLDEFAAKGTTVTNLHGFFAHSVFETILAGILAIKRGIDQAIVLKNESRWRGSSLRPDLTLLHESKAIILGAGSIGQRVKTILDAFGTDVLLYDCNPMVADLSSLDSLDHELPSADIVVTCLPDLPETRGLFDENRLSLLSGKAVFVNVGRGTVVDEASLLRCLGDRQIAGAVLDVTCFEPLPPTHGLWKCPNLILTQHTAGGWTGEMEQKMVYFLENLRRYLQGKPLKGVVANTPRKR